MYDAWRQNGGPTLYPSNKTAETTDVLLAGFIFAFAITGFTLLIVILGFKGKRIALNGVIIMGELLILASIILCNFGQDWEVASVTNATLQYKAGLREEIHADVGVSIGLRSVNITLKSNPTTVEFNNGRTNETIDYNERFSWDNLGFHQGNTGFGPRAGLINREYRAAQQRGTPYPILWVAEYFTIDGEGIRWGRYYRQAGYFAHILMWLAFPLWVLAILMFSFVLRYAGYYCMLTGLILGGANIIYILVRNPTDLAIPFSADYILVFSWGWCFWINFATACLTFIIGVVVFVLDITCYKQLAAGCGVDIDQDTVEIYEGPQGTPTIKIQVSPADENEKGYFSRPIMSARLLREGEGYSTPVRLVRKKSIFGSFQREPTVIVSSEVCRRGETVSTTSGGDDDDASSCATSTSSLDSGCKSLSVGSTSSSSSVTKHRTGRNTRKITPVSHK